MSSRGKLPVTDQPAEVAVLIAEMMNHVHRRWVGDTLALMNELGLTMAQMVTLHIVGHKGGQSISGIAAHLRLSAAATSHLVDRLVRVGLLARAEDPVDRRQKSVSITPDGRRLVDRIQREHARQLTAAMAPLSAEARRQFSKAVSQVIEVFSSLPQEKS